MDDVTRLLSELVAIPSVNPMGRPIVGEGVLEGRLTDYLEAWFRGLGVVCRRQPISPGRDNLLAWYEAPTPRRTILFDVHQDTVPTDGMTIPPFEPAIAGGRLYGRGSCDVKGSMAAMLAAFARLVRERPAGSASVLLACTVDEEFTHTGSSRLAEMDHGAELAIVAEPTLLNLVHCHKGALRWKIRTRGVACHSSTPHRGVNAIYRMGRVLDALESFAGIALPIDAAPDPRPAEPVRRPHRGRPERQHRPRLVRDRDRPPPAPGRGPRELSRRAQGTARRAPGRTRWDRVRPALGEHAGPLASGLPRGSNRSAMPSPRRPAGGPTSSAYPSAPTPDRSNAAGTPCVVFGPGDIAQAHTKDEWIDLEQVQLAAEAYYQIAVDLGRLTASGG